MLSGKANMLNPGNLLISQYSLAHPLESITSNSLSSMNLLWYAKTGTPKTSNN